MAWQPKPLKWRWNQRELEQPYQSISGGLIGLWPIWGDDFNLGLDPFTGTPGLRNLISGRGMGGPNAAQDGTSTAMSARTGREGVQVNKAVANRRFVIPGTFDPPQKGSVLSVFRCSDSSLSPRLLGFHDAFEIRFTSGGAFSNQLFAGSGNETETSGLSTNVWYATVATYNNTIGTPTRQNFLSTGVKTTGTQTFTDPGTSSAGAMQLGNRASQATGWLGDFTIFAFWDRVLSDAEVWSLVLRDPYGIIRRRLSKVAVKAPAVGGGVVPPLMDYYRRRRVS
jgi:hypothetical protein